MAEGRLEVKARLAAKGYENPDWGTGLMATSGRVSPHSSHLQVISLIALTKWNLWSLGTKNAPPRADGSVREVCLRAPLGWRPQGDQRIRRLKAPDYGLNDAPAAFHKPLDWYLGSGDR